MTIDEILDYVTETPENTNRAVLKDMLNELDNHTDTDTNTNTVFGVYVDNWNSTEPTIDVPFENLYNAFNEDKICVIVIWSDEAETFYLARITDLYAPGPHESFEPYFMFSIYENYYQINSNGIVSLHAK